MTHPTQWLTFKVEVVSETAHSVEVLLKCNETGDNLSLSLVHKRCSQPAAVKAEPKNFPIGSTYVLMRSVGRIHVDGTFAAAPQKPESWAEEPLYYVRWEMKTGATFTAVLLYVDARNPLEPIAVFEKRHNEVIDFGIPLDPSTNIEEFIGLPVTVYIDAKGCATVPLNHSGAAPSDPGDLLNDLSQVIQEDPEKRPKAHR